MFANELRKFYKYGNVVNPMKSRVKRGLSPVVATVLLIALAIILAMIIFIWARGWISEQIEKKGKPIDQVCDGVKIDVGKRREGNSLFLSIVNLGPYHLNSVEIRQEGGGSSIPAVWEVSIPPMESSSVEKEIILLSGTKKVTVYPQIMGNVKGKGDTKVTTCLGSGKVIDL